MRENGPREREGCCRAREVEPYRDRPGRPVRLAHRSVGPEVIANPEHVLHETTRAKAGAPSRHRARLARHRPGKLAVNVACGGQGDARPPPCTALAQSVS